MIYMEEENQRWAEDERAETKRTSSSAMASSKECLVLKSFEERRISSRGYLCMYLPPTHLPPYEPLPLLFVFALLARVVVGSSGVDLGDRGRRSTTSCR